MEKDTPLWKKRETESKIHWPLQYFRKIWTISLLIRVSTKSGPKSTKFIT